MKGVYLLLGSNLGDSKAVLQIARKHIEERIGKVVTASSIYLTKAWGIENQPDFLNQVLEIETVLKSSNVLKCILFNADYERADIKMSSEELTLEGVMDRVNKLEEPMISEVKAYLESRH